MKRLKSTLFTLLILCISLGMASAQQSGGAQWPLTDPDDGGTGLDPVLTGQVQAMEQHLNNMEINHYSGPNNSQRVRIEGNEWPANQTEEIKDVYIQFELKAAFGNVFSVDSISLGLAGISINTMKANVYYSTDSGFTDRTQIDYTTEDASENNYLGRDELQFVGISPDLKIQGEERLFIRVYPWVDADPDVRTGKYLAIQNVSVTGTTESLPVPASVTWPLSSDEQPQITGSLVAGDQSYSSAMKLYNFSDFEAEGEDTIVTAATIQTVRQDWTAATGPIDTLFIQYEVEPKFGGTFYSTDFSLRIGGWYSSNLRASIMYDFDEAFENPTTIIQDTSLAGSGIKKLEASLIDTVETGEKMYIRIYPYNTETEGWAKLVAVSDVTVSGITTGVTADPPEVATFNISYISTTFASAGGNITTDGGAPVSERGVVWNTTGEPTVEDPKTIDGEGSGSFNSQITDLTANTTYFVRSYATNSAGTGYGREVSFTTRAEIAAPSVITDDVTNILATSAESGGFVSDWGGDTVRVRGMVWSTDTEPTLSDDFSEETGGLGSFKSALFPLDENTTYFVRAYATNSAGTGYGSVQSFKTQSKAKDVTVVVAQDGSGDYTKVQDAFDDVLDYYTGKWTIVVKNGRYYEKLLLKEEKVNVQLIGEDHDSTILYYDDYAGIAGGTSQSYSVSIDANDFVAKNITFQNPVENDKSVADQQAVALSTNGDRQAFYNVNVLGFQDTYYARGSKGTGRIYFKNSLIEGSVDYIFGRSIVVFDSTRIHSTRDGGTITAAATEPESKFGFVFLNSEITADEVGFDGRPVDEIYLGRPWQAAPRTVFINTRMPEVMHPVGWMSWNVQPALYAEYNTLGPGANPNSRHDISTQLTEEEASEYTIQNIFSEESNPAFSFDWMPEEPDVIVSNEASEIEPLPTKLKLRQNYPNPFNPSTTIGFQVPEHSEVRLEVFDMLGRKVATLINQETFSAGTHSLEFNAKNLASGMYLYRLTAGSQSIIKKLTLLK